MKSLRKRVFEFLDNNNAIVTEVYKNFSNANKTTVRRYFYDHKSTSTSDITSGIIEIINIDTIREMEIAINQIKDPIKRCENLSRLHAMKLRPLKNLNTKTLKELLEA